MNTFFFRLLVYVILKCPPFYSTKLSCEDSSDSHKPNFNLFLYSSNHSGNNGSSGSLPSSAGPSLNSEDINNGDHLLNNNTVDNGIAEVCDVPDDVANQKRHVSNKFMSYQQHYMHAQCTVHNVYIYL